LRLPEGDTLMQDFRENPNEDFRQAYASTALENDLFDNGKMEVDLASPWQRIGARLLDIVIFAASAKYLRSINCAAVLCKSICSISFCKN